VKYLIVALFILGFCNCVKSQHYDSSDLCFIERFYKCLSIDTTAGVGYFEIEKIDDKFLISKTIGNYSQEFKNVVQKTLMCVESTDIPKNSYSILVSIQHINNSNHKVRMDSFIVKEMLDTTNLIPFQGVFFDAQYD